MGRLRIAVIGAGRLGRACAETILRSDDLHLAGIVRRSESLGREMPSALREVRTAADLQALGAVNVALVCVPAERVTEWAHNLLQHGVPVVECAAGPCAPVNAWHEKLHHLAERHHAPAVTGAGWDPGAVDCFHRLFAMLVPKGREEMTNRPGVSLHHTLTARAIEGVKDALCTELRRADGGLQRYVYIELTAGADADRVAATIRAEPLFLNEETLVFPVESIAALEEEGAGIVLQRRGSAGSADHQLLLLEARFDRAALAAQVMVAAAQAIPGLRPGGYSLSDLPLGRLCPQQPRR
jgi:diaminopimelate dehydrogenase